jgi:A/G-specific adenine glycosylase
MAKSDTWVDLKLPVRPSKLDKLLTDWFSQAARDLPWRSNRTGYRVWLSEVMLQQTQVSVVVDYYQRFLQRFPSISELAAADEDQVLALWSGLGYYSRGRNLHKAAKQIVAQHKGQFPKTYTDLLALPGIGPYTAGAIASLAFGEKVPIVDGNVARVLSRLCDDATPIDSKIGKEKMQARAASLVTAAKDVGPLNEGLMELGALLCTPKGFTCDPCPWRNVCQAKKNGTIAQRPAKKPRAKRQRVEVACTVITHQNAIWLERRSSDGLFGGLYEPPSLALSKAGKPSQMARQLLADRNLPAPPRLPKALRLHRVLTHRDLHFHIYPIEFSGRKRRSDCWVNLENLENIGISSATREILRAGSQKVSQFFGDKGNRP